MFLNELRGLTSGPAGVKVALDPYGSWGYIGATLFLSFGRAQGGPGMRLENAKAAGKGNG